MGHYGGSYKVTYDLYKKYGDMRLLDTPICGAPPLQPAVTLPVDVWRSQDSVQTLWSTLCLNSDSEPRHGACVP